MKSAKYKLLKVSGGVGHYAKVSVTAEPADEGSSVVVSDDVFAWLKDVYGPDAYEWNVCDAYRDGAKAGAAYALKHRTAHDQDHWKIVITKIDVSPVDSTEQTVAFATCMAVWDAIGDEGMHAPYFVGRAVVFPMQYEDQ